MDFAKLFSLEGRVAVVTGGSRGIGRMIAEGFIAAGCARVYITARKGAVVAETAAELGERCIALPGDISTLAGIEALAQDLSERESALDILVNNAGVAWGAEFDDFPEMGWDKVMNLNVKTPFFLTQKLHKLLKAGATDHPAKVINIASVDGLRVNPWETYSYQASKSALVHLTRRMAARLVKDNIMFSGFTGDQLNLYEAATGSTYFDQPGSLTFVWKDGRTFAYDHHTWMEAVRRNFDAGRSTFFPCEPGWAFAACNTIGAQALLGYEVLHGNTLWSDLEPRWRATLDDEYALPDGNFANIRCTRTGLSWDTGETPGGEYLVTGSNGFADVAPDLSLRGRAIATRGLGKKIAGLRAAVKDGELAMQLPLEWERNRARQTAVNGWTKLIAGARMVGDTEVVAAARKAAGTQCRTGERWPERPLAAGVQNMATHMIVRWAAPMDTAMLNLRGYVPPVGPVLGAVPWPQAIVTTARSVDGVSLDVEIRRDRALGSTGPRPGLDEIDHSVREHLGVDAEVLHPAVEQQGADGVRHRPALPHAPGRAPGART